MRVTETNNTLQTMGLKVTESTPTTVSLESKEWFYKFNLLAAGDFNRDGNEDLLIYFLDQAKEGSYFSMDTLLLSRLSNVDLWTAVDGVSYIRSTP